MLEELKSDEIVKKVGGRFKLAALIQKRMLELLQGSRPLIDNIEGRTMMEIVVQEILQDKIAADMTPYVRKSKAEVETRSDELDRLFEKRPTL
ncbi:MAG: DNA-directed RNA polymerase subunit omega [Phycisphaerales bacterium]